MSEQLILEFLNSRNYDLRIGTGSKRWIDQKCTPDVLWSIADFVCYFVDHCKSEFTPSDIWRSEIAGVTIPTTFSKPNVNDESVSNEYDKVFSQPLNLLSYSGIIEDISLTDRHLYVIRERYLLDYIATNDVNSYRFLVLYIEKVLQDSGMFNSFKVFFNNQSNISFRLLKTTVENFYFQNTQINNRKEVDRIFTKILNPLACNRRLKGTIKGRISNNTIRRSDLMYNQDNFRDIYSKKPKEISRTEWLEMNPNILLQLGYFIQMERVSREKLKFHIKNNRNNISEYTQFIDSESDYDNATQVHHIFPKNEYPELCGFAENLIALTPNQHFNKAHLLNSTHYIDPIIQIELIIAKVKSIKHDFENQVINFFYNFENIKKVINIGYQFDDVLYIEEDDYQKLLECLLRFKSNLLE